MARAMAIAIGVDAGGPHGEATIGGVSGVHHQLRATGFSSW